MASSLREKALEHSASKRFHQSFNLPANPEHGRPTDIPVTYSDTDYRTDKDGGPIILMIGGMFGGRFLGMGSRDALSKKHQLRLIIPDKFGLGGTGTVPLEHRIDSWLDLVPALLAYLDVKHVALICHSNGTIYLFNTILYLRHILHPTRPYIAILAPWVDPSRSGCLTSLTYVPNAVLSKSPFIIKFFVNNITPALMFSSGVIKSIGKNETTGADSDTPEFMDYDPEIKSLEPELNEIIAKLLFSEDISGGRDEVFLCLKRGKYTWGALKDYDDAVPMVVKQERDLAVDCSISDGRKPEKLRVEVFFAENDSLVGNGGEEWFRRCWKDAAPGDYITYTGETVPGTGHDDIFSPEAGVVDRVMATTVKSFANE